MHRTIDALISHQRPGIEVLVITRPGKKDRTGLELRHPDQDGLRFRPRAEPSRAAGRNEGLKWSRSDIVAFLDEGCVPLPDWADTVRSTFDADPSVAAAIGVVLAETPQPAPGSRSRSAGDGELRTNGSPTDVLAAAYRLTSTPGAIVVHKGRVPDLWRFDPDLGPGSPTGAGDDLDAVTDLLCRGLRIEQLPAAIAHRPTPDPSNDEEGHESGLAAVALKGVVTQRGRRGAFLRSAAAGLSSVSQLRHRMHGSASYVGSRVRRSWTTA